MGEGERGLACSVYSQGIPLSLPPQCSVFSTHGFLVGAVGSGSGSSSRELISVPKVCTFPFQEGLARSPGGHG